MTTAGRPVEELDSPQLVLDLEQVDANLARMQAGCARRGIDLRFHFKSVKCLGLARYVAAAGVTRFLCAKLNEAELLADGGLTDLFVANQVVGPIKLRRLAELARRARVSACADDAGNIAEMGRAAQLAGTTLRVLVEVDTGMGRCGVEPGGPAVALARHIQSTPGLCFGGLQGYDGHLQMIADVAERRAQCHHGLEQLIATRRLIEEAGIPVPVVTGGGTGTWEFVADFPGVTEVQPGSFLLMDCAYHGVRPEFGYALSVLATVISRRNGWYILDAGSKAVSRDFGNPVIKGRPEERVVKLSEEHTKVETTGPAVKVGDRREVVPSHCCATMNLHRQCVAVRKGLVEAEWPIEASGRYD